MNIKSIMEALGITDTYDTALPQQWMDERVKNGFDYQDLYRNYVWLYDEKAKIFGRPFNFMAAYNETLIQDYKQAASNPIADWEIEKLVKAFHCSSFPVNPLPFLNGLIQGIKANGTDSVKTDEGKSLLHVVNSMAHGQLYDLDAMEEFKRLKQIFIN